MYGTAAFLTLALMASPGSFDGQAALRHTRAAVALGPRPSGSAAIRKLQAYILARLKPLGCEIIEDDFIASTPAGPVPMKNIIAKFAGTSGRAVAITGHYDTKVMPGTYFVGANDGGSSTGLLLELARAVSTRKYRNDVYLVWFDGEESVAQWSATDGTYGSRHLAAKWASNGTLSRLKALINVDMIGDRDLGIQRDMNSSQTLLRLVWQVARDLGYSRHFLNDATAIEDDHVPFLVRGVNAVDLIDFEYGPGNAWWHTDQDTIDKLSPASLQVVGQVLLELTVRLD
ncbi:MAG TPA: M28 family peptidase [Bryobacteraceae bacterium]|nr:M28 family peptidase [Bryobacteraceae bacterium]